MGVRKNAKYLSPTEIENFVKACVFMKADIVNPAASAANRYSRWDECVAIHQMIQNAFAPGSAVVNFGHGGISAGAYAFLSWHRYFLYRFELQLQGYVPGVMLPYWDWTDPATIMTDTFLGPNGSAASSRQVRSGYFALNAPGTPGNPTPAPAWWPAGLTGWLLPAAFGSTFTGALKRNLKTLPELPTATDLHETLGMTDYHDFTWALESGTGLSSAQQMHNGMHTWIGGGAGPGHMSYPSVSPLDPIFYLHHCNIDRLWAMWQADGHATEYPSAGALPQHGPTDLMYPWTGGAAGYGPNAPIGTGAANIPMPNFAALGAQRNMDTLDYRGVFGYSYDTVATIGIGLDRTGSMSGMTPDPMTTGAPDVTKWDAAKRGVAAFLQDCGTVQDSGINYVIAGVKTFRKLAANDFANVFPAPGYGLVKPTGSFSRTAFNAAVAAFTPGGSTPLADALLDVKNTLVEPPFAGLPADERRYLAMLTDGILTDGAPMSSIANGSLARTAVFAMGFGTGADVDYPTLQSMVDKGQITLSTQQLFHGESAGTIDKFYTNALARAIGFTAIFDPVLEMFAGEHTHLDFFATSADDIFLISAQGMDFIDENWSFALHGPGGMVLYADHPEHKRHDDHAMCPHCCKHPHVTVSRANGRLTIVLQRDNADDPCWIGAWSLMVAYKARYLDGMLMETIGSLMFPMAAGPARGARHSRLLVAPKNRIAQRNIRHLPRNGLDEIPVSTNRNDREACDVVVNIYGRTRLNLELLPSERLVKAGAGPIEIQIASTIRAGALLDLRAFSRFAGPTQDLAAALAAVTPKNLPKESKRDAAMFDPALALARLERKNPKLAQIRDEELPVVTHHDGPLHVHFGAPDVPGVYHVSMFVEGAFCPDAVENTEGHNHGDQHNHGGAMSAGDECPPQRFTRLLTTMIAVEPNRPRPKAKKAAAARKKR